MIHLIVQKSSFPVFSAHKKRERRKGSAEEAIGDGARSEAKLRLM